MAFLFGRVPGAGFPLPGPVARASREDSISSAVETGIFENSADAENLLLLSSTVEGYCGAFRRAARNSRDCWCHAL